MVRLNAIIRYFPIGVQTQAKDIASTAITCCFLRNHTDVKMLFTSTNAMVRSVDRDIYFFDMIGRIFQCDTP